MTSRITILLAVCWLNGCANLSNSVPVRAPAESADASGGATLQFLERLATASAAELEAMPARRAPGEAAPKRRLRHALWLATPGHAGHDAAAARRTLTGLLESPRLLDPTTRALARLQLRHLHARQQWRANNERLTAENRRLQEQIQALTALEREMNGGSGGQSRP
jgi:hypothetical protein